MPIRLTAGITEPVKHGKTGGSFPEAKIIRVMIDHHEKIAVLTVQYGETVGGDWKPSPIELADISVWNVPANPLTREPEDNAFDRLVSDDRLPTMQACYDILEAGNYGGTIEGQP